MYISFLLSFLPDWRINVFISDVGVPRMLGTSLFRVDGSAYIGERSNISVRLIWILVGGVHTGLLLYVLIFDILESAADDLLGAGGGPDGRLPHWFACMIRVRRGRTVGLISWRVLVGGRGLCVCVVSESASVRVVCERVAAVCRR